MRKVSIRRAISIAFLLMLGIFTFNNFAFAQVKPKIAILATGGTIAGVGQSEVGSAYKSGAITVDKLLAAVPQINTLATVQGEQVVQIGSQDMNDMVWLKLAKRINELAKTDVQAFVITHGTDTQEETAYFLNLVLKTDKPVVLVGSMRASTAISADGPKNLYDAVACAIDPSSKGRGVMIVMDDKILGADDVTKTMTTTVETFACPNYGPLGIMYNGKPMYTRTSLKKHTVKSEFSVDNLSMLPRVEIIYGYSNVTPLFVDAAVKAGVKGIVYAGVGNGNPSTTLQDALVAARKSGVAIVRSSRVFSGPTSQYDEVDDDKCEFAASWYKNPQKARVLLMLALTKTNNYKEIQRMFIEY
jgi:L-asparaginases, type II